MRQPRIIAIGDAVCDKYLSRGKMYPGGQCINTCAYAHMNNAESALKRTRMIVRSWRLEAHGSALQG